jgi:solute carrier family 35 protein F5
VVLVSLSDSKSRGGTTTRPGITHTQVMDSRATFGDVLALTSALFYALYVILLKVRIKTESRIDMRLFFGFVGLLNILICWPIGVFLNFTKLEIFEPPSGWKVWQAILINVGHISSPNHAS